jgi:hypothetical protein
MAQLVEAMLFQPKGCWFDFRLGRWIFHLHNPSSRTKTLESTQSLIEMSTRNIS